MTQGFDDFKRYHNNNYHDGDSHFNERTYQKSNGDDFDSDFVQDCYDHFEAGAASRQAEVDELKAELEILQGLHNATCLYAGELFNERGELQKRIDELDVKLKSLEHTSKECLNAMSLSCGEYLMENKTLSKVIFDIKEYMVNAPLKHVSQTAMLRVLDILEDLKGKKDE